MSALEVHYIVRPDGVELVGDRTARAHRLLVIDEHGDATVYPVLPGGLVVAIHVQMSRAEVRLLARAARRAAVRRFWARLLGRR